MQPNANHGKDRKQHRVKTYARRESRITPAQKKALSELLDRYQLPLTDAKLTLLTIFPESNRFAIEIGFGDGEVLVQQAMQNEDTGYLGIEVYRPGVGKCLLGLDRNSIRNVRISTADARDVLNQQVPSNSVDEFMILFPDPWPKARHRKRRLINADFIELCVDRLVAGGTILITTDSSDYADQISQALTQNSNLERLELERQFAQNQADPKTRYARKALQSGHSVFEFLYTRLARQQAQD